MSERRRPVFTPGACFDHDLENDYIEVELPGVDKGHIEVSVSEQSICVVGSREDVDLLGCWYLGHSVNEDKAMHACASIPMGCWQCSLSTIFSLNMQKV